MPLETGQRLGVFEILARLGMGGMGEVDRAHNQAASLRAATSWSHARIARQLGRGSNFL